MSSTKFGGKYKGNKNFMNFEAITSSKLDDLLFSYQFDTKD